MLFFYLFLLILLLFIIILNINFYCGKLIKNAIRYKSLVVVLTVWKRNNLLMQLNLINTQTILKWINVSIIVFQNANHINISNEINEWKIKYSDIFINIIHTSYETGYYGRFLVPLTFHNTNSYFIICDDDILFGSEYFENMLRVVDSGYLATRNGRFIDSNYNEITADKFIRGFVTWDDDLECDFGGHIWAGKIEWLKLAWKHPSPTLLNCEDFWISAVLKVYYNISTKVPKCPFPRSSHQKPSMCACSDLSAKDHVNANIGNSTVKTNSRSYSLKTIKMFYNYKGIIENNITVYYKTKYSKKYHSNNIYDIIGDIMEKRCLFFI